MALAAWARWARGPGTGVHPYLRGPAGLPHHPGTSFALRLGLLVPDWSLEPDGTTPEPGLASWSVLAEGHVTERSYLRRSVLGVLGLSESLV